MEPLYTTTGISTGDGRNGTAALADGTLEFSLAIPPEMGGKGGGANPEQLFALGYAACFHSALKLVAGGLKKRVAGSTVAAEVTLGRDDGDYGLAVTLTVSIPELTAAEVRELIEAAHEVCPYSKATHGNIPVTLAVG
jgi:osmotically inducible protein OsmC